jgi:hypothetical protein
MLLCHCCGHQFMAVDCRALPAITKTPAALQASEARQAQLRRELDDLQIQVADQQAVLAARQRSAQEARQKADQLAKQEHLQNVLSAVPCTLVRACTFAAPGGDDTKAYDMNVWDLRGSIQATCVYPADTNAARKLLVQHNAPHSGGAHSDGAH